MKSLINCHCIKCGIEIKPGYAIYICKVNAQEYKGFHYKYNKETHRYERILSDGSTRYIQMFGGTRIKHLVCLTCFNEWYQIPVSIQKQ